MPNTLLHHPFLRLTFILLGIGWGFSGCLQEIDLEVPKENSESLAIRGVLIGGELPSIIIKISTLADFSGRATAEPVIGASVVLLDDENHGLDIPMQKAGHYELTIPDQTYSLEVKPGRAYQVSIAVPNGKNYLSSLEPLYAVPLPTAIDQVPLRRTVLNETGNFEEKEYRRFLITTPVVRPDNQTRAYLKWDFLGTYKFKESEVDAPFLPAVKTCYISDALSPEKVVVFDGSDNSEDLLTDFFLLEQAFDYRFSEGFYLSVFQQSVSENAFKYWREIGRAVEISGNFFDAPPGKIRGNFRNVDDEEEEVFGYFYAAEQAIIRLYIPPEQNTGTPLCPAIVQVDEEGVPSICRDCLARPGSTIVKPDFWDE